MWEAALECLHEGLGCSSVVGYLPGINKALGLLLSTENKCSFTGLQAACSGELSLSPGLVITQSATGGNAVPGYLFTSKWLLACFSLEQKCYKILVSHIPHVHTPPLAHSFSCLCMHTPAFQRGPGPGR